MNKTVRDFTIHHYYGVVSDTPTWRVLIPVVYEQVIPHMLGFSCKVPPEGKPVSPEDAQVSSSGKNSSLPGTWDVFSLDGTLLLQNCANALFVNDNILLVGTPDKKCILLNLETKKVVVNMYFDAILVFLGDNDTATEFDATTDVFDIVLKTNYQMYGAHIESKLCIKYKGLWGVIDLETGKIVENFTHKAFIQKTGNDITVVD